MHITEQDIDRLAALAQLNLTPAERTRFADELTHILEFVGKLKSVDTTGVLPVSIVGPLTAARPDQASLADSEALRGNIPSTEGGAVKTPRILQ